MDLILACSNCFSAVLIIFLAYSALTVVFNLILTGTNSFFLDTSKGENPMVFVVAVP